MATRACRSSPLTASTSSRALAASPRNWGPLTLASNALRINVDGRLWDAVASWGRRPTVDNGPPLLEVCLFDFSGDLYGKTVEVAFVEWIRPELKFDGLEALTAQIEKDCGRAREILAGG